MPDLSKIYLYRMTHIENISHILKNGITHSTSPNYNKNFVPVGDNSLISTRNNYVLDNGKRLGEYIPFYFGVRMPMLYVLQHGYNLVAPTTPEHIVYAVSSVQKIIDQNLEFIFTDGHAVDSFSTQYTPEDIENIDKILDKTAINAKYWKAENDLDLKRRKEAEFLVLGDIKPSAILRYIVYNQDAKKRMLIFGVEEAKVSTNQDYYF